MEVWGAQGGNTVFYNYSHNGGYGGYSVGVIKTNNNQKNYINVGGQGVSVTQNNSGATFSKATIGWNGGTPGSYPPGNSSHGGGGGATHIATVSGQIKSLSSYKDSDGINISKEILIVAGGGGGASSHVTNGNWYSGIGGAGGGISGNNSNNTFSCDYCYVLSYGGSQTSGGSYLYVSGTIDSSAQNYYGEFGQGGSVYVNNTSGDRSFISGGGGGWYGGCAGIHYSAAGGSGYIGSSNLISGGGVTKHMTCYSCTTSTAAATRTNSNTNVSATATADYSKTGNGYAKITWVGDKL